MALEQNELDGFPAAEGIGGAESIVEDVLVAGDQRVHVASQWQLIWWRFRRHKLALGSGVVVIMIYLVVLFAEFIAPYDPGDYIARYTYAPPQTLHLFDTVDGQFVFSPYVNDYTVEIEPGSTATNLRHRS